MTDDQRANPYHPGRVRAGGLSAGQDSPTGGGATPATPAETQFPYIATQGIQPTAAPSPPSPEPAEPRFRNRRPRRSGGWAPVLIGLASGLFVLAVLGAYLVWGPTGNPIAGPTTPAAADATGPGAVRGYLQALAAGDADAALGFAATPPQDATLLTDEVLATLIEDDPITGIEVEPSPTGTSHQLVVARYQLGDRSVSASFEVLRQGEVWRLAAVAAEVDLKLLRFGEVPLTINGVALATATPALFPGHYTIATTADRYAVENPDFTVEAITERPAVTATLGLSSTGRDEVVAAASSHLKACVKRRKLDPADCGFAITNPKGTKLKESTMRWSLHSGADDLADMELVLDHPGSATAAVSIGVRGEVRGTDGSRWKASVKLTRMRADLTGDKVTVQFA